MAAFNDPRMDKIPIRADMATIINTPTGMTESKLMTRAEEPMSSATYNKRKMMQQRLIDRLVEKHGSDPKCKSVVTKLVESSGLLKADKITPGQLNALEAKVGDAVRAIRPAPSRPELHPQPNYAPPMQPGELANKVKQHSNWTDVAMHRNGYYNVEIQRRIADKESQKAVLRTHMHHQMSLEQHRRAAERATVEEERRQVAAELASFEADRAKELAKKRAKQEAEKAARASQLREQAARQAAAQRLQQLEDEEMEAFLRKEIEKDLERKQAKQRANEEYHRSTTAANAAAKVKAEEEKQKEWAEEAKLNAQWKAMLDKQEDDRNQQYAKLRERIHKMQRAYEGGAGADLEKRLKEEEEIRDRYVEMHEKEVDVQLASKKSKRQADIQANVHYLKQQMATKKDAFAVERQKDQVYAKEVLQDVAKFEEENQTRKALVRARMAQQTSALNEQVELQKSHAARDPGSSHMTDLEAAINRPLLVSIAQHKYLQSYANPLTG